jgi:hypothetical protein
MDSVQPAPDELDALLRLLDDETPEVRQRVAERFTTYGGDISEWLATHPRPLDHPQRALLAEMLSPSRRETLAREWIAPTGGAAALQEDWESFEALLRLLSDFLHDGISLRQPLSDALDLLAEEAADDGVTTERELCSFLFDGTRLVGNHHGYHDPRNSDLAWCLAEGRSNPLGLCVIFILIGRRLDLEIEGVNFPGHFMCRIYEEGYPVVIDCFDAGRMHFQSTLMESPDLNRNSRKILERSVGPGTILLRLLNNLMQSLTREGRTDDLKLIEQLRATME